MFNEINKINPTAEFEPSLANLKAKLGAAWMDGDYAAFSAYMKPGATMILADWRIERGVRLLDVACGAGQIAIPAAKTGARVTGVDIASNLIEAARKQAASEGLHVQFDEGDAENLPYPDGAFDVVISLIGAMFAPRPERVASELAAGLPLRRPSLYGELDAGRHGGSDVQDRRETCTTATRHGTSRPVGR